MSGNGKCAGLLSWLVIFNLFSIAMCQFGVPKTPHQQQLEQEGVQAKEQESIIPTSSSSSSQENKGRPSEQASASVSSNKNNRSEEDFMLADDAWEIAQMVQAARSDPETMMLVDKMKREQKEEIQQLKTSHSVDEIMLGMKQTMDDIKLLDVLFRDKAKAVEGMIEDSLIDKQHIKKYRKNPELLEEDTRRGLYFQFVSFAVAGDFI